MRNQARQQWQLACYLQSILRVGYDTSTLFFVSTRDLRAESSSTRSATVSLSCQRMRRYQHCLLASGAGKVCLFHFCFLRSVVATLTTLIMIIQRTLFICLMKSSLKVLFTLPESCGMLSFVADHTSTNTVRSIVESVWESQRRLQSRYVFDIQHLRNGHKYL